MAGLGGAQQVDVTLHDVDQICETQLAAVYGVSSKPRQPQLQQLQALARKSSQMIALVDSPTKVLSNAPLA